jgi:lactocepin
MIVLGGGASISSTVVAEARVAAGLEPDEVERIQGPDRYATSAEIAKRLRKAKGHPDEVLLASGMDFPDALALSSYAARTGQPIILTRPDSLPLATSNAISDSGADSAYIAGGPVAVSPNVEQQLMSMVSTVTRAAGANRYDTSGIVTKRGIDENVFGMQRFVVASGAMFPDATSGGWLAARVAGPVVLTNPTQLSPEAAYLIETEASRVLDVYVMGGPVALSDDVVDQLQLHLIDDAP